MPHQQFFQEIKKDHQEVKDLLQKMKSQPQKGDGLLAQLKEQLTPHLEAEEHTLYKTLADSRSTHSLALKAVEEHHVAKTVLDELEQTPRGDRWQAKLSVFDELVNEHMKEEESEVFEASRSLSEEQIDGIMKAFLKEKDKVKAKVR